MVRKFIILLLLTIGASTVSAECSQADLVGRWDFTSNTYSCKFFLTEKGQLNKASCDELYEDGSKDTYSATGEIKVNKYCKVTGYIETGNFVEPESRFDILAGRLKDDKLLAMGEAYHSVYWFASFGMIKY